MSHLFYDHLTIIEEVTMVLDSVTDLTASEKKELLNMVDSTLHYEILDEILKHLPSVHHEVFLAKFTSAPFDATLLEFVSEKSGKNIQQHIVNRANRVKKKFIHHIKSPQQT